MDIKSDKSERIAIVGAGLVGSLCACVLANRGFKIDLFELRDDIRQRREQLIIGRSINLALSTRGLEALSLLDDDLITKLLDGHAIPMHARMIHRINGTTKPIYYGQSNQCIYSVGRRKFLLEMLINCTDQNKNVDLFFEHKLKDVDFDLCRLEFETNDGRVVYEGYKAVLGCDGVFSKVRQSMMRRYPLSYEQKYIPHGYLELPIDTNEQGDYMISPNYLHVWPRGNFMMIALPNENKTFTGTVFMPFEKFEKLQKKEDILKFYKENFPDILDICVPEAIVRIHQTIEPQTLPCVKCSPYHTPEGKGLIIGDAAHAQVPFYGQGMNAGFEDVLILNNLLDKHNNNLAKAFAEFTEERNEDAKAIVDLSLYNYIEMRDLVNKTSFRVRKAFDNFMYWLAPNFWIPLYTSVTFTRMRYSDCVRNKQWQDNLIGNTITAAKMAAVGSLIPLAWMYSPRVNTLALELISKF